MTPNNIEPVATDETTNNSLNNSDVLEFDLNAQSASASGLEPDLSFELESALSFEDIPEDDKSYVAAQGQSHAEKQKEILAHLDAIREEIQLTLIPDVPSDASGKNDVVVVDEPEIAAAKNVSSMDVTSSIEIMKSDLSLPAVLCDDELLQELAQIPDRLAFKIGDVADMLGIKQYVLRYWESEFEILKPKKASNNQRMYAKKDVENAYLIRKLLHRDRFSIEGARQALRALKNHVKKEKNEVQAQVKMTHKILTMSERLESLVADLRKLKESFRT